MWVKTMGCSGVKSIKSCVPFLIYQQQQRLHMVEPIKISALTNKEDNPGIRPTKVWGVAPKQYRYEISYAWDVVWGIIVWLHILV